MRKTRTSSGDHKSIVQFSIPILLLCAAGFAKADVVTSVSCYSGEYPSVYTGMTSCYAGPASGAGNPSHYYPGAGYASSTASITFPNSPSDYLVATVNTMVVAAADILNNTYSNHSAAAFANGSVSFQLNTGGPQRLGYVQVFPNISAGGTDANGTISADIAGVVVAYCSASSLGCVPFPGSVPGSAFQIPIELGQAFTFSLKANLMASDYIGDPESASANGSLQFRFLESDGVTPVAMLPEPGTAWLIGVALIGVYGLMRVIKLS